MLSEDRKREILSHGKEVYLLQEDTRKTIYSNHRFAEEPHHAVPAYILAEERFTSGHDDSAGFVEIIDTEERILKRWRFDFPMIKQFTEPDLYDDDCLILYLAETFGIPVIRGYGYTGYPSIIKLEELV